MLAVAEYDQVAKAMVEWRRMSEKLAIFDDHPF